MAERSKRERKTVEHFTPSQGPAETKRTVIPEGTGVKFGDIPNVSFKLDALKSGDELLEVLHTLLYKSKGKATTRKREIKAFSGFVFPDESQEAELSKVESKLAKLTVSQLNSLLDVLDLPRGGGEEGNKDKKVKRVLDFLKEPLIVSEKDLAAQAAQKKEKAAKAKAKRAKPGPSAKDKPPPKKAKVEASAEADKPASTAKKTTKKDSTKADAPAKKAEAPAKKADAPAKKAEAPAKKTDASAKKAAKAPPAKAAKAGAKKRTAPEPEDKPAKKARKAEAPAKTQWPAEDQVKADVSKILDDAIQANEELTPKEIYARLGEKYTLPLAEIKKKKELIKTVISQHTTVEEPEDAATGAAEQAVAKSASEKSSKEEEAVQKPDMDEPLVEKEAASGEENVEEVRNEPPAAEDPPALEIPAEIPEAPAAAEEPPKNEIVNDIAPQSTEAPGVEEKAKDVSAGVVQKAATQPDSTNEEEPTLTGSLEDVDQYINQL